MALEAALAFSLLALIFAFAFWNSRVKGALKAANSSNASPKGVRKGTYTVAEVREHRTRGDCWIIIKNKVYDVTSYVEEHPGGDSILNNAGGDSTEGFYGPQHVTRVFQMIEDFYIGDVQP